MTLKTISLSHVNFSETIMRKLATLAILAALVLATTDSYSVASQKTYSFKSSRKAGTTDRVELSFEAGGESEFQTEDKPDRVKMSVVCKMNYNEKTLQPPDGPDKVQNSIRYYKKAEAIVKQADGGMKPKLRPSRRTIGVEIGGPKITMFSPHGPLTRDELELLNIQCSSLLIDSLIPETPVTIDQSWTLPNNSVCALFGLDVVAKSDVKCTLKSVESDAARFEMHGQIEGAFRGMATKLEVKAKYRFNLAQKRIDWVGLLIKENRDCGHIVGGLDAVARLQLIITPEIQSKHLSESALKGLNLKPTDDLCHLVYKPAKGNWEFTHNRRWHIIADQHDVTVLRLIDRGKLVTQCNVTPLPHRLNQPPISLAKFQEDIKLALDQNFGQFIQAGQRANQQDYRILHAIIHGTVSELPIEWKYYLVTDEHGHRVAFTFTTEASLAKQLADSDKELINSLRFTEVEEADDEDTTAIKYNHRR